MRLLGCALALLVCAPACYAQTVSYEYDALGRLKTVTPSSGNIVSYSYDLADNRTSVIAQPASGHPVTVSDTAFGWYGCPQAGGNEWWTSNAADNDYDTANTPFSITAVSGSAYASVVAPSQYVPRGAISYAGPATPGTYTLTYTVTNSIGATATGAITVTSYQMDPNDC